MSITAIRLEGKSLQSCPNQHSLAGGKKNENQSSSRVGSRQAAEHRGSRSRRAEEGRGARPARRDRRLPHRRVHVVGRRSRGRVPVDPGSRRRRRRRGSGQGREERQGRRSRDPAVHAGVQEVQVLQVRQDESLRRDSRDARQRPDARRHEPLLEEGQADPALHGHVDVLRVHRAARDRAREDREEGAAREGLPARLRHHDGHRRRAAHGEGEAGLDGRRVRLGRRRLERASRAP